MGPVKRKAPAQRSRTHWMDMVNRERAPPKPDLKESSKQTMRVMEKNFIKFAQELDPPDPRHWLVNLNLNVVETFLRWYLEIHNVVSLNGFLVRVQYWRIYYCYETSHDFPYTLKRETKNLICGTLKEEYDLQETMRFQLPINADSLLSNLYFDLTISDVWFPTEQQRRQHETVHKMMTVTSAQPRTLLVSSGYCRKKKDGLEQRSRWYLYTEANNTLPQIMRDRKEITSQWNQ
ncbi:hypothetical protein LOZ12_003869 [Ophidiomyces ophidiicola]|nr:hypothetical protein LOZ45_004535 [Ophidiomyces ophidiicola]KAI2046849.1 hypothetical protein LOZ44_004327 [Ophidiomyces ophidiicola]KAI2064500.1 hypothetical protein LOZ40_004665 [Ophidiomyces ophidiicola]KAI2067806.1 hypothetical protein LOZ39_006025 [Ophidiomyces ophidiicola]KAI2070050.1 hypothetical protein LOZ37_005105 [Ophidiomyces ophidiicola]